MDLPKIEFQDPVEKAAFLFVYRKLLKISEDEIAQTLNISRGQYDQWRFTDPDFSRHVTTYARRLLSELQPEVSTFLIRRLLSEDAGFKDYELYFRLIREISGDDNDGPLEFHAAFGIDR